MHRFVINFTLKEQLFLFSFIAISFPMSPVFLFELQRFKEHYEFFKQELVLIIVDEDLDSQYWSIIKFPFKLFQVELLMLESHVLIQHSLLKDFK